MLFHYKAWEKHKISIVFVEQNSEPEGTPIYWPYMQ